MTDTPPPQLDGPFYDDDDDDIQIIEQSNPSHQLAGHSCNTLPKDPSTKAMMVGGGKRPSSSARPANPTNGNAETRTPHPATPLLRPPLPARPIRFVPVPPNSVNRSNQRAAQAQALMDKFLTRPTPQAQNDNNSDEEFVEQQAKPKRPDNPLNKLLDCAQFNGDHYTCINAAQVGGKNFNGYRIVAQFELNKLEKSEFPDEVLKEIFRKCLEKAKKGAASEMQLIPNHYFVQIDSELLDTAIYTHIKRISEAAIDEILTLFEKIDQSNKKKERETIRRANLTVDVFSIQTKGPPRQKRKLAGAGKKGRGHDFEYNMHRGALYAHPDFPDNYCLFYSLEWSRQKYLLTADAFRRWKANAARQQQDVFATMNGCGIARGQPAYSVYDCGRLIQNYYDSKHPGIFRIIVFLTHGEFKPKYKTKVRSYEHPLILLYSEDEHYEPVEKPGRLFMECGLYCFACEKPYLRKSKHNIHCRGRCKNCETIGAYFPCVPDNKFHNSCVDCCKEFKNAECFEKHLLKVKGKRSVCQRSHRCPDCGVVYKVTLNNQENGNEKSAGHEEEDDESISLGSKNTPDAEDEEAELEEDDDHPSFIHDGEISESEEDEEEEAILTEGEEMEEHDDDEENLSSSKPKRRRIISEEDAGQVEKENITPTRTKRARIESAGDAEEIENDEQLTVGSLPIRTPSVLSSIPMNSQILARMEEENPAEDVGLSKRFTREDYAEMERVWKESEAFLDARRKEEEAKKKAYKRPDHVCGDRYCKKCKQRHNKRRYFIGTRPTVQKDRRIIVYDFESTQNLRPDPQLQRFQHQVNFASAHVMCYRCIDAGTWDKPLVKPCEICGEHRTYTWASFDYEGSEQHRHTVVVDDEAVLSTFTDWLLHFEQQNTVHLQTIEDTPVAQGKKKKAPKRPKTFETICYAHNGSRYDHIFVFGEILKAGGLKPEMIRQGNTLLQMKVKKCRIITTTTLQGHSFYSPGSMFSEERKKFLQWYEENKHTAFCLKDVLADYCNSDVKILAHGLVKMRQLFKDATGNEITESITLPSALMKYFVSTFPEHQAEEGFRPIDLKVAKTPHLGYDCHDKQSLVARKYIKYWSNKHQVPVQFCESEGGEHEYKGYKIDAFVKRQPVDRDLAMEIFGCWWHACPRCYPLDDDIVANGETAGAIRRRDAKRIAEMEKEMEVKIKWECDIRRRLKYKEDMQKFFDDCFDTGPIDLHEAFFGGRTSCEWNIAEPFEHNEGKLPTDQGHKTIKYKDFVSLYPYVNFSRRYPISHPETKVYNAADGLDVNWTDPAHIECPETKKALKGIIKCFIVPPLKVPNDIPAMPFRANDHLLFPLCRTCALSYPEGLNDNEYSCEHREDKDRGFVATTSLPELEMALTAGYRVTKLIRWWNWIDDNRDWCDSLFQPYIRKFMKIKYEGISFIYPKQQVLRQMAKNVRQLAKKFNIERISPSGEESSGWPEFCLEEGITEEERARRKQLVIDIAYAETGIKLDPEKMIFNPGLRYVAKLCLNSLWGRFALRNKLSKSVIVYNVGELARYLDDDRLEMAPPEPLTENYWLLTYKDKDMHLVENYASNPIIALYTTAYARCHLLKHLWMPDQDGRKDCRILYMDTDSIIYEYETLLGDPLPEGNQLGELKDEYPGKEIAAYCALGPKAYMLRLRDPVSGKEELVKKCRGVLLHYTADAQLDYERVREMVLNAARFPRDYNCEEVENRDKNFRITRDGHIFSTPIVKKVRPTYFKGVLRGHRIVPFGYVHNQ